MLDLGKISLFTTAQKKEKKRNSLCPSYSKRVSDIHVWSKTNWEEQSDRKEIILNVETIGWESVFDLIREINRGKQGHRIGLNNL